MNIFHPRVVTLVLELLTSNDVFVRRSPFNAPPAKKEGKIRQNGNDRRYGASRWSCARIYLDITARNVIKKVLEFQIGHPGRWSLRSCPRILGRCLPIPGWRNSRVFPLFCWRETSPGFDVELSENVRRSTGIFRVRLRRHLSVHWPDRMM